MREFGLELSGATEVGEELVAEIVGLPPLAAKQSFVGGAVAGCGCLIGVEQVVGEDEVVGEAFGGIEVQLQRELRADGLAGIHVREEVVEVRSGEYPGDAGGELGEGFALALAQIEAGELVVVRGILELREGLLEDLLLLRGEVVLLEEVGQPLIEKRVVGIAVELCSQHRERAGELTGCRKPAEIAVEDGGIGGAFGQRFAYWHLRQRLGFELLRSRRVTVDGLRVLHSDVKVDSAGFGNGLRRCCRGGQGKAGGFGGEFVELGFVEGELVGGIVLASAGVGHQAGYIEAFGSGRKRGEVLFSGGDNGCRFAVLGERADELCVERGAFRRGGKTPVEIREQFCGFRAMEVALRPRGFRLVLGLRAFAVEPQREDAVPVAGPLVEGGDVAIQREGLGADCERLLGGIKKDVDEAGEANLGSGFAVGHGAVRRSQRVVVACGLGVGVDG